MPYCLNPTCPQPENPETVRDCLACGRSLWLSDRYLPLKLLGQGAFGRTVLTWDEQAPFPDWHYCVIKQTLPMGTLAAQFATELPHLRRVEVEQLRSLGHHPQIPALIDDLSDDHQLLLVQEYVDGMNLADHLAQTGTWTEAEVRSLLVSVLPVLDFIHQAQVIHRDIKPANIIAARRSAIATDETGTYRDNRPTFVLVDFGAAKRLTTTAAQQTGTIIGSAAYAAPEQALGKATFTSDLYSLGVTCLHLLTGEHPFDLYSVAEDGWRWQAYLDRPVSSRLVYVLNKLTRRNLAQRYQSAAEALRDLQATPRSRPAVGIPSSTASVQLADRVRNLRQSPVWVKLAAQLNAQQRQAATSINADADMPAPSVGTAAPATDPAPTPRTDLAPLWHRLETLLERSAQIDWQRLWQVVQAIASVLWSIPELIQTAVTQAAPADPPTAIAWQGRYQVVAAIAAVRCLAIDTQRAQVITGHQDGRICSWDIATGDWVRDWPRGGVNAMVNPLVKSPGHRDRISGLLVMPGDVLLSSSADGTIKQWDLATLALQHTLTAAWSVTAIARDYTGSLLVSGGTTGQVELWDWQQQRVMYQGQPHPEPITGLAVAVDSPWLVSSSTTPTIQVWDGRDGTPVHPLTGHLAHVTTLATSASGQYLASGDRDGLVKLWQLPRGERLHTLAKHQAAITAIAFSPSETWVATGDEAGQVMIWDVRTGERWDLLPHPWSITAIAAPSPTVLLIASQAETFRCWELEPEEGTSAICLS